MLWDAKLIQAFDPTMSRHPLNVELEQELISDAAGISGDRLKNRYGDVELRIESDRETVAWKTTVGFVDFGSASDEVIILGHGGCLDFLSAIFDGEYAELQLTPNALLPS